MFFLSSLIFQVYQGLLKISIKSPKGCSDFFEIYLLKVIKSCWLKVYDSTGSCLISCSVTVEIGSILSQSCSDINTWSFSKYRTMLSTIQCKRYTYIELTLLNVTGFLHKTIDNSAIATLIEDLLTFLLFLMWEVKEYFLLPVTPLTDDYVLCFLPTFYQFLASSLLSNSFSLPSVILFSYYAFYSYFHIYS